jgi:hypothetical protein
MLPLTSLSHDTARRAVMHAEYSTQHRFASFLFAAGGTICDEVAGNALSGRPGSHAKSRLAAGVFGPGERAGAKLVTSKPRDKVVLSGRDCPRGADGVVRAKGSLLRGRRPPSREGRRSTRLFFVLAVNGGVAVAAAGALAQAHGDRPRAGSADARSGAITSVEFLGTPTWPVIVVRGHHLGKRPPARNPSFRPSDKPLCRLPAHGKSGYDHGTRLYLVDGSATPVWTAGRYRPRLAELDCIGLMVFKFTPHLVRFGLGGAYRSYAYTPLEPGSRVRIAVNGAMIRVRVKYTQARVPEHR